MKKIPTMFERDWDGDPSRVTEVAVPDCLWVGLGQGHATRKWDGTCVMIRGGALFKRREVKAGKPVPDNFVLVSTDEETGKRVGWVTARVDDPGDKWHWEAFNRKTQWEDGTYELVGPKVQGNREGLTRHVLVRHGDDRIANMPRDHEGLDRWFATSRFEGVVFYHPDGRMAKIKGRDFGHKRVPWSPRT